MSQHPAYTMAGICMLGGAAGFARTRSRPSLIAGLVVGSAYALAGYRLQTGADYGHEIAAGASAVLLASSVPRFRKGPIPQALAVTSLLAGGFYLNKLYRDRVGY
ncbi:uncharacterized protein L969DRAFT_18947 [Mixia osmundae IAM 14324]|uniref:Transmembrane protein 14 n=1 Tax=Mixia osmundae (strain CBS 9802 / IAM 14324 / JCM 22182 / KY 12970) TaxID=764103 RepID=G7DWS6_MIXOS|nr:uncharacterized protein L969DRAFT_20559 [Mixia osmundae IAM 14324]XP_014566409.1 uncharacterized protein L969DRAFT_18947 [Mixia osmundae IAM 14324]KEI36199.1 hypothetical protein L969DRAFT_20559 [Mixia osmundae IAM 14324]KEI38167.1 hypothetical protein L969DRAFT_18947 [Mixia osmundae IAM 14324]GAA95023.1 hypothetical protein E5Q_01678 [Mixia osmundae IAM 14324]